MLWRYWRHCKCKHWASRCIGLAHGHEVWLAPTVSLDQLHTKLHVSSIYLFSFHGSKGCTWAHGLTQQASLRSLTVWGLWPRCLAGMGLLDTTAGFWNQIPEYKWLQPHLCIHFWAVSGSCTCSSCFWAWTCIFGFLFYHCYRLRA